MSARWMPRSRLSLPAEQLARLPCHPAYEYEVIEGEVWVTPRPVFCNARLGLREYAPSRATRVAPRPLRPDDWEALVPVFASAFRRHEPFASAGDLGRREAALECLAQTRAGW